MASRDVRGRWFLCVRCARVRRSRQSGPGTVGDREVQGHGIRGVSSETRRTWGEGPDQLRVPAQPRRSGHENVNSLTARPLQGCDFQ